MRYYRTYFFVILFVFTMYWTVARGQQSSQPARSPAPAKQSRPSTGKAGSIPPAKPDAGAVKVFENALKKLEQLDWVEATFWQQLDLQGLTVQATGNYLASVREQRLHLNLTVNAAGTYGKLEIFCDGEMLWQVRKIGNSEPVVDPKVEMKKVLEAFEKSRMSNDVRGQVLQKLSFAGVTPLMEALAKRMTMIHQEKAAWEERWGSANTAPAPNPPQVIKLTAVWNRESARAFARSGPWPVWVPRQCRIFLDQNTGWPYRLEWWGPVRANAADDLLMQFEFRNPKLKKSEIDLSPERMAREFTFKPGPVDVKDDTSNIIRLAKDLQRELERQRPRKK